MFFPHYLTIRPYLSPDDHVAVVVDAPDAGGPHGQDARRRALAAETKGDICT